MKIGLFFGSFNPIHIGHLIIAEQILNAAELDLVWLMVSPQNPFKKKETLLNQYDRINLVELATQDNDRILPSDFEFHLPLPSYTIDTLTHLKEKYPDDQFFLIMGLDNLKSINKWKNSDLLLSNYKILVYDRPGIKIKSYLIDHPSVDIYKFPQIDISSTYIRNKIKQGESVKYYLHHKVEAYIKEMNLYK